MKTLKRTTFMLCLLAKCLTVFGSADVHADELRPCGIESSMENSLTLFCGPQAVEDMQRIPATQWLIGSGMGNGNAGGLHLIDTGQKTWRRIYPDPASKSALDTANYSGCPGAPAPDTFSAHGIALKATGPNAYQLLAVNHAREAVEVFDMDTRSATPEITWVGCVLMPDQVFMNSVTFLPDGGFAVTRFFDRSNERGILAIHAGEITGGVLEWHRQSGITELAGTDLSGANGIAVMPDKEWLFVSAWGSNQVVRFSGGPGERKKDLVDLDFAPDNLRWAADGSLLVAGQHSIRDPQDPTPILLGWEVIKLDPRTMEVTKIAEGTEDSKLQGVSNAIEVDGMLWLGAWQGDKIGYMPMP